MQASQQSRRFSRVWASGRSLSMHAKVMRDALGHDEARRLAQFGHDADARRAACVFVLAPKKPGEVERLAVEAGMKVERIEADALASLAPVQAWELDSTISDQDAYRAKLRAMVAEPEAYGPEVAMLALRGEGAAREVVLLVGRLGDLHQAYPDHQTRAIWKDAGICTGALAEPLAQLEGAGASPAGGLRLDTGASSDPKRRA